jgi:hypothetical protein
MRPSLDQSRGVRKTWRIVVVVAVVIAAVFAAWRITLWHQLSRFRRLTTEMREADVVTLCGKPARRDGSGFLFLHYRLVDGSEVVVACASQFRVISVTHDGEELLSANTARDDAKR